MGRLSSNVISGPGTWGMTTDHSIIMNVIPQDHIADANLWYGRVVVTDLDDVQHDLTPMNLSSSDVLKLNLDHLKADDFYFSFEDYAGDKRDWLERGCMVEIFIDRFTPATTLRLYGMVELVNETWPLPSTVIVTATGRDKFSIYLDRVITETYLDKEVSVIVKDLLTLYAPEIDQTNIDVTTTTLDDARFPYRPLKEVLNYLATVSGFTYRCDPSLNFYWKKTKTEDTFITYLNTDMDATPDKISSLYPIKNRVYVLGGDYMEVDQESTTVAATKNTKDFWYAQRFTPERSSLNQVSLHLKRTGDPDNLEGEIRSDDPGNGPSEVLGTFTIDADFIGTTATWRPTRVDADLRVGFDYWIVLRKTGDAANNYEWSDDNNNTGVNANSGNGVAGNWIVQAASYLFAFKTHYSVPVIAVKQDYDSGEKYIIWREHVHRDEAIASRAVAKQTAQALLDELVDETPSIKSLNTIDQDTVPDQGKLITLDLEPLKIDMVQYQVRQVSFVFKGGQVGTHYMDVFLGRSSEELDEWLNRLRLDIDRISIGSFGVEEGLVPMVEAIGPDEATAGDSLNLTVVASGAFEIGSARIDFSDIS